MLPERLWDNYLIGGRTKLNGLVTFMEDKLQPNRLIGVLNEVLAKFYLHNRLTTLTLNPSRLSAGQVLCSLITFELLLIVGNSIELLQSLATTTTLLWSFDIDWLHGRRFGAFRSKLELCGHRHLDNSRVFGIVLGYYGQHVSPSPGNHGDLFENPLTITHTRT